MLVRRLHVVVAVCALTCAPAQLVAQVRVFFGNLHSHTKYSDGSATPEVAYQYARDSALVDFLAITEHNHASAGRIQNEPALYNGSASTSLRSAAHRFTENGRFVALYGQEFSAIDSGNHANVFEVRDVISEADVPNGAWDKLLNNWIPNHLDEDGREALLLLNHPATSGSPNSKEYGADDFSTFNAWRTALDARARLINIVNGPSHQVGAAPASPSESEFRRYLNLGFHLAPTADQDNHRPNWGDAAETRTAVLATELTRAAILTALRERHVYATQDRNLRLIARINGELIGSRIVGASVPAIGTNLSIQVAIEDDDEPNVPYRVLVFSDTIGGDVADVVATADRVGNGPITITNVKYVGGAQYVFLKVLQSPDDVDGQVFAWTAPVWLEPNAQPPVVAGAAALTLSVDRIAETAAITNIGMSSINLQGWTLVSVNGDQRLKFASALVLGPGKTVTVTSGPGALNSPPLVVRWTTSRIWNNDGDPGQLLDPHGAVVAESP